MVIHFYVGFRSLHGQSVAVRITPLDKTLPLPTTEIPLHYLNEAYWHTSIKRTALDIIDEFEYTYVFRDDRTGEEKLFCKNSLVSTRKITAKIFDIIDEWTEDEPLAEVFSSKPFEKVFSVQKQKIKVTDTKSPSHVFKVNAMALAAGKAVCIIGAGKKLNDWDETKPILLEQKKNYWQVRLNLNKEIFPLEYKIGIYDLRNKLMDYEAGANRVLPPYTKGSLTQINLRLDTAAHRWKGAGINVPVSALRTGSSWGVGDFTDLNLLTDFAKKTGIKLIQLLPINDTTSTHSNKDSYPYSAVSAFALQPVYLNVQKLATALSVKFSAEILQEVKSVNSHTSLLYQEVHVLKQAAIRLLYEKDKQSFKDDMDWFGFFDLNRHWLVPYAAYCYLRDKNKTADYNTWGNYELFDEDAVQALVSPENDFYDEIAVHYFTQYHLHLQLKDAVDYAHKSGVIIKGDLPIGVGRHSADAWMYRSLFHMDMQAGAPPDAFATKGQNWSFPTYNWQKMASDDYAWWRQRMEHMSNYFDAIRIDHVLGFFRIWSIPLHAIEGILGKFVPAWPLSHADITNAGVQFTEERFCEPHITEELLTDWFAGHASVVKDTFLQNYQFKEEYNTQRKLAAYFTENDALRSLQPRLCELLSNVICLKDELYPYTYHFRIGMHGTESFNALPQHEQQSLSGLYDEYFFNKQNILWEEEGIKKLAALKRSTDMLICAEDLGMVPAMVEGVLANMQMLALEVQRMPKKINEQFSNPADSPYLSVVTPSTHDMATIREWWEEDKALTRVFYNNQLGHYGEPPYFAEPWVCRDIVKQHLNSPAMWAVFLVQDLLSMNQGLRIEDPKLERINNPADPDHYWNYRMHMKLEDLMKQQGYIDALRELVQESGR